MDIQFDFHTHTTYSHGKGSVFDTGAVALQKGLVVAITDHGAEHRFFGVNNAKMKRMKADIEQVNRQAGKTVLLQGLEANITGPGKTDIRRSGGDPQIVLLGYHKGAGMFWGAQLYLLALTHPEKAKQRMTDALLQAVRQDTRIVAISHPGLYVPVHMAQLAAGCAACGVALELSARHPLPIEDAKCAFDAGARFIISSDAHNPEKIGVFDRAIRDATSAGIPPSAIVNAKEYVKTGNLRLETWV